MSKTDTHPIRRARLKRGLSQDDLGRRLGVTKAAVSKWEGGRSHPGIEKAKQLAAELKIRLEDVFAEVA